LWKIFLSRECDKKLKKEDPEVARRILQDLDILKEDPLRGSAVQDARARKINLRYIEVARDYRAFYLIEDKRVFSQCYYKRETCYEEIKRYLAILKL